LANIQTSGFSNQMHFLLPIAILLLSVAANFCFAAPNKDQNQGISHSDSVSVIQPYIPRFGRTQPVVAVVGENSLTELTDYVIPYGVLHASGVAEVIALATQAGPIQMFPALKIRPQATVAEFDSRFPEGADYVIVPAVHRTTDPTLINWITFQAAKGASIFGVCDGVWVVANAGLLKGKKAVAHWYSLDDLERQFPTSTWVRNRRYLADGQIVTTTGVTASIPVSLALVEAIGGQERARSTALSIGSTDWSAAHTSSNFKLRAGHMYVAATNWLSFWSHEEIGIPISNGVNEVALAVTADAYSRTYRSSAVSIAPTKDEVLTRGGLVIVPDRSTDSKKAPHRMLSPIGNKKPVAALDAALRDITEIYGQATSAFVALQLEYPQP
jgi:transcriptional regulator GlxA family with amidase domain